MKNYNKLVDIQVDLADGKLSCVTLVQSYLANIQQNQDLNAFLEVFADEALARAVELDKNQVLKVNCMAW
jgi:aspartyl-tRNA(Asn)/glutamyl-tRNA(Gln) amidotransferase subunit A